MSSWKSCALMFPLALLFVGCADDTTPGTLVHAGLDAGTDGANAGGADAGVDGAAEPVDPGVKVIPTLIVLVTHNGVTPMRDPAATLTSMREADMYYRRSSCGALLHRGVANPAAPADIIELDVGDMRKTCDEDLDCHEQGVFTQARCLEDPNPGDGVEEGACRCSSANIVGRVGTYLQEEGIGLHYESLAILFDPTHEASCLLGKCTASGLHYYCSGVQWHEMGHILGFDHANMLTDSACYTKGSHGCDTLEYGDTQDIMGFGGSGAEAYAMNLPHIRGAGWLAGRAQEVREGTYCLHPFDPPADDWDDFCADQSKLRALEIPVEEGYLASTVHVGLRGQTGRVSLWEARAGSTGSTVRLADLEKEADFLVVAERTDEYFGRPAWRVERGPACEGDGVEVMVELGPATRTGK